MKLVEKLRTTEVKGEVVTETYKYDVDYSLDGNILAKLNYRVHKKTENGYEYVGYLCLENGKRTININDCEDIAPHIVVMDAVLAEVEESLKPIPVTKVAK